MKIYSNYLPIERYNFFIGNKEKYKNIPITIFNDKVPNIDELKENPINILILNEPNEFFGLHDFAINNKYAFNIILTWSDNILRECENSMLFIHGETNLDKTYIDKYQVNPLRQFEVTFLSGILEILEGHKLRQRISTKDLDIIVPHKWWKTLDDFDHVRGQRPGYFEEKMTIYGNPIEGEGKKQIWNRNSMFHVAVENSQHLNYYTDKIMDCFATKTIPIYWGAPNIGEHFNKDGIITFQNENELVEILNNLTKEDYTKRLEAIEENYMLLNKKGFFFKRLETFLDELIKINNL